jgi:hypothetical protein
MYSYPRSKIIKQVGDEVPDYMYPSTAPWLVISEGRLSADVCNHIVDSNIHEDVYKFPHCSAETRECQRPLHSSLEPISSFLVTVNQTYWQYELGDIPGAWMQTYRENDKYQLHMDGTLGQTRKLTAIAMLSDPGNYVGGDLTMYIPPHSFIVPKVQGTIVVFPHWVLHQVTEIKAGVRQTINLGYWGPPFR